MFFIFPMNSFSRVFYKCISYANYLGEKKELFLGVWSCNCMYKRMDSDSIVIIYINFERDISILSNWLPYDLTCWKLTCRRAMHYNKPICFLLWICSSYNKLNIPLEWPYNQCLITSHFTPHKRKIYMRLQSFQK